MSIQSKFENLLSLNFKQAKLFFLQAKTYTNIDLPPYYDFQKLLNEINIFFENNNNFNSFINFKNLKATDNVNYKLYSNKDGNLSWRKLEFINPVLYVYLVNIITQKDNWSKIRKLFKRFQKNKKINCVSIPVKSLTKKSDKAEQISNWWKSIEQKSIELALDFDYLFETDISDCYGSLYTHSIAWAIESKSVAKSIKNNSLLGNQVDSAIQSMQYGQTNGIPQGSVLMDFIAEIVLGYVGVLTMIIGLITLIPLLILLAFPEEMKYATNFMITSIIAIVVGYILKGDIDINQKYKLSLSQDAVIVVFTWLIACLFSSIPYSKFNFLSFL